MGQAKKQNNKSRSRIISAFKDLLRNKDYCDISIGEILDRADVSKSTFYRHFERKLEVLLDMHDAIFERFLSDLTTKEDWLSTEVRPSVEDMFIALTTQSNFRRPMSFKLDKDWPQGFRLVKAKLADYIEQKLIIAFNNQSMIIPIPLLSATLAAMYIENVIQLVYRTSPLNVNKQALHMQTMTRSIIVGALKDETNPQ
ncbi:TetR/AcrR family transcriptional regulator [Photobacterium sanguinicancri]|uniref:TetR/AcrR family transcriptional regulator n=1 Tax=Photobacterium sanguinicancri TaxID=875932 RepID=UPI0026E41308|nr:TetR/AcrR family transcriptional regulator [Photobacterium sanguinicancri]MDO6498769.1 TetR/AcrR family transcriptional regulator [Photobacterium sanguinicancri]